MKTYLEVLKTFGKQDDPTTNEVVEFIVNDPSFPNTTNIEQVARYIYLKMDHQQTTAFQKTLMMYFYIINDFKQPEDPNILIQINRVVELQNDDPNYQFNS